MDTISELVAYIGPLVLTALGAYAASKEQRTKTERNVHFWAVLGIGIVVTVCVYLQQQRQDERLQAWITGGKSYPYIKADLDSGFDTGFDVWIYSSGTMRDVTYEISREVRPEDTPVVESEAVGKRSLVSVILEKGIQLPLTLSRGIYNIDFVSPNGSFRQHLVVEGKPGSPNQQFTVKKDGVVVHKEP